MDNRLCWLPRYWIEIFRKRTDPRIKVFIYGGNIIYAMKLAAKHERAKSVRKIGRGFLYSTYQINFGR